MRLFGMAASPSRRLPAILSVYLVISIALTLPHNTGAQNKAPDKKGKDPVYLRSYLDSLYVMLQDFAEKGRIHFLFDVVFYVPPAHSRWLMLTYLCKS